MKSVRLSQILFFALVVLMAACKGGSPKEMITKKWKVDADAFEKLMKEEIEKMKKDKPEEAKNMEAGLGMLKGMMGSVTFEFKADGTAEMSMTAMGQTKKGKWTISEDGKKLTLEEEGGKKEDMDIEELSKSKLVLKNKMGKEEIKLPFVPAN